MSEEVKEIKETVDNGENTNSNVEETIEKNAVSETVQVNKKQNWANRLWSSLIGVLVGIGAMFGVTTEHIETQRAKAQELNEFSREALNFLKAGDVANAKASLELAVEAGAVFYKEAKEIVENVKEFSDKNNPESKVGDNILNK